MTNKHSLQNHCTARLILALLLMVLMLPNIAWLWHDHSAAVWVEALAMPTALLLLFFAVFGDVPWLGCLLLSPLALLAPLEFFFIATYQHPTSAEVIATVMATSASETHEYLGRRLIPLTASSLAAFVLSLYAAWLYARCRLRWRNSMRTGILLVALVTPLAAAGVAAVSANGQAPQRMRNVTALGHTLGGTIALGYPFGVIQRIARYRSEWNAMRADSARMKAFHFGTHPITSESQRQIYVLVIGESSRRDHWQLFGYQRATNPELSQIRNLIPIPHMVTSWPVTIGAVPLILTRKPITDRSIAFNQASILRAMQEADFETYWISNQMAVGQYDTPVSVYAYEARHVVWLNHASWNAPDSYDGDLLQPLRGALRDPHRNLFIVLHMMGSHLKYDYRYPPTFKRFRPTQSDRSDGAPNGSRMRNSYDNTILYTDHILAKIIDILRSSDAITALWYESDHGEMLVTPTCSLAGHGIGTLHEYQIPAFFWYSDAYADHHPKRLAVLRDNAGKRTLSADTFSSLVDMADVTFPGHDETRSLFSQEWEYRPRIVNANMWSTDFDKAAIGKKCPIVIPP
jgi:glucan phosphoethanolaminetransferase (alkaline phosphatase superfamily)